MISRALILFAVCLLEASLGGCGSTTPALEDSDETTTPATPLRIATDATFAPFHFLESGEPTGFDIELARRVTVRAGFTPVVVVRDYDLLFTELARGDVDLLAATTGLTPEREKRYLFSKPYFTTCQAVLVRIGANEPDSIADLAGRRVGAPGAGTSLAALQRISETVGLSPVQLDKGDVGADLLLGEKIDALILDEFDALAAVRDSPEALRVLREPAALEEYGFVMRRDAGQLKARIDTALDELRAEGVVETLARDYRLLRAEDWPIDLNVPSSTAR